MSAEASSPTHTIARLVAPNDDELPDDIYAGDPEEFVTVLRSTDRLVENKRHVSWEAARGWGRAGFAANGVLLPPVETGIEEVGSAAIVQALKSTLSATIGIYHPVLWVEDEAGHVCRQYSIECRTVRRKYIDVSVKWDNRLGFVGATGALLSVPFALMLPEAPILHQPKSARRMEVGELSDAMRHAQREKTGLSQRVYRLAREKLEAEDALHAFETLFEYYSYNEELWRLREWVEKHLPFALEEHPKMDDYRTLLKAQVGHIDDLTKHYAEDSPSEVVSKSYVETAHFSLSPRYSWLIEECRKRGFKRVVELGSVDGISLFPLMQAAPDIEWHGLEVNPKAVDHGRKVAAECGLLDRFHLHHVSVMNERCVDKLQLGGFDAAFVSEVLEHNSPANGHRILDAAEVSVGRTAACGVPARVFISTPNGNWSICDESTRDLSLRKDHINAYTAKRMAAFLQSRRLARDVQVQVVENPSFWEANSWVFASYDVHR